MKTDDIMLREYINTDDYGAVCIRHSFINLLKNGDHSIITELREIDITGLDRNALVRLALLAACIEFHFGKAFTTGFVPKFTLSEPFIHELSGPMIIFYACNPCVNYQVFVEENYFSQV